MGVASVPAKNIGPLGVFVAPVRIHHGSQQRFEHRSFVWREQTVHGHHAFGTGREHESTHRPLTGGGVATGQIREPYTFDFPANVFGKLPG